MVFNIQTKKRLTVHEGWDGYAVWSPDASKIIFDREDAPGGQKRPWVMRMDDFTIKPLGNGAFLGCHEKPGPQPFERA